MASTWARGLRYRPVTVLAARKVVSRPQPTPRPSAPVASQAARRVGMATRTQSGVRTACTPASPSNWVQIVRMCAGSSPAGSGSTGVMTRPRDSGGAGREAQEGAVFARYAGVLPFAAHRLSAETQGDQGRSGSGDVPNAAGAGRAGGPWQATLTSSSPAAISTIGPVTEGSTEHSFEWAATDPARQPGILRAMTSPATPIARSRRVPVSAPAISRRRLRFCTSGSRSAAALNASANWSIRDSGVGH